MKKIFAASVLFFIFLLSGCVQKDLIDIYLFSERFSKHSENFEINTSSLIAEEENYELIFPVNFSDKFLLTVRTDKKTSLITSLSVLYAYGEKKSITDKDFFFLKELIDSTVRAFTNYEITDDIFKNLSIINKESITQNTHRHFEKDTYKFSLVANDVGIYFSALTERR